MGANLIVLASSAVVVPIKVLAPVVNTIEPVMEFGSISSVKVIKILLIGI